MSELQNFIDEERKNIAKAIIVDDLCNDREDKEQRCKRCRFKCLLNRDSIVKYESNEDNSLVAQLVDKTARYIFDEGAPEFEDIISDELIQHMENISSTTFYKKAKPFASLESKMKKCINDYINKDLQSNNQEAENCFDLLTEHITKDLQVILSDGDIISLSSYLVFNKQYDEEWFELSRID